MRAENRSPHTLAAYAEAGRQFQQLAVERNWPTDPATIEKKHIEDYLIWLRVERQAMPGTVRSRFSALRRFFNWLLEEEEIERNPMARMHGPRVDEPAPAVLSVEELEQLLEACKGPEFKDRRDLALLRLMLDTGLRRFEVAGITLDTLDLGSQSLSVIGKGGRAGTVFFGAKVARELDRYLRLRARHLHAGLPALWLAQKGALTGDGVHHILTRRARLAGLERPIWPHLLRHTWAHSMKQAGASDEDVMTLGRWQDSKVMRRYGASAAISRARDTHRRLSPGDRLG